MMCISMLNLILESRIKYLSDNIDTTNKRMLKKSFMSGMKKRINSRVLLQNFIKKDRINEGFFTLDFYPKK